MNLYLILAIALGAISSVVDAPVLRPVQIVSRRESRRQQRQVRASATVRISHPRLLWWKSPAAVSRAPRPYGIGSPRAPSAI